MFILSIKENKILYRITADIFRNKRRGTNDVIRGLKSFVVLKLNYYSEIKD